MTTRLFIHPVYLDLILPGSTFIQTGGFSLEYC